jgi:hypothetical protein
VNPRTGHKDPKGVDVELYSFSNRRYIEVGDQSHASGDLSPEKRPISHSTGGWVGPRADLDGYRKSRPTGIRSPDRPARVNLLYRLRYPGPPFLYSKGILLDVFTQFIHRISQGL